MQNPSWAAFPVDWHAKSFRAGKGSIGHLLEGLIVPDICFATTRHYRGAVRP